mmetsp:Transcript_35502/g.89519  ORF Transcript_35502/g.89519 Transcript_35502/m.89519 type:complete len:437 (+) Transcript_35502:152-1462(+)
MPRPRAPTRALFEHTGTRRCGGKFDVYRCKRCGVEILENAYRFAVHISVCKKATDEDRALAQQQLTKSKKGSNFQSPRNSLPGDVELAGLVASVRERAQSISGLNKDDLTTRLLQQVASRFQQDSFPERRATHHAGGQDKSKRQVLESQAEVIFPAESLLDSGLGGGREFYHVYSRDSQWDSQPLTHGLPSHQVQQQRRAYDCEADLPQYNFGAGTSRRHSSFSGGSNVGVNPFAREELAMAGGGFDGHLGDGFEGGIDMSKDYSDDLDALVAAVSGGSGGFGRSNNLPAGTAPGKFGFGQPQQAPDTVNPDLEFERFEKGGSAFPQQHYPNQPPPQQFSHPMTSQPQQPQSLSPTEQLHPLQPQQAHQRPPQQQPFPSPTGPQGVSSTEGFGWGTDNVPVSKDMTTGMTMRETIRESMGHSNMPAGQPTFSNGFV